MAQGAMADHILNSDIRQSDPTTARRCPNGDHGRLTLRGTGNELVCGNLISEQEAKALHERGRPLAKLDASKKYVCAYVEPVGLS